MTARGAGGARHRLRAAERACRAALFMFVAYSGFSALAFPPGSYADYAELMTTAWGVLQLIPALIALWAVATGRVLWEWRMLPAMIVGVSMYAALGWVQAVTDVPSHGGRAGDISALVFVLAARFFYLWRKVVQAQIHVDAVRETEGDA